MQRQLAYLLARQQVTLPAGLLQKLEEEESPLLAILNNASLSTHFKDFCKTLSLLEPKSLEDVYKSHLDDNPSSRAATGTANIDSARQNLAGTFVNAFVNVGCANDKLMIGAEEGQSWIYKNKDDGMLSAAASLGLLLLWDPEMGLSQIDKYSYASEEHIKAGALLANGIIHSGIKTEMDAAIALLGDYVENKSVPLRTMATIGCVKQWFAYRN
jgi:26S proteasome regulatory subunit N1